MALSDKRFVAPLIIGALIGVILTSTLAYAGIIGPDRKHFGKVDYLTQNNLDFKFIKPLLDVEFVSQEDSLRQFPQQQKIKDLVEEEISKHKDVVVGFYFNDLANAGWFGVNEDEKFIPASLLKMPMLIAYYKLQETETDLFSKEILFQGRDFNQDRNTSEASNVKPGSVYSVQELLRTMIVDSDNNALELLYEFRKEALKDVFEDLQVPLPDSRSEIASEDFLSPKEMAKFYLVLYHGSYLRKADSDEALKLLSEVKYKDGLVAGVPSDVVVSHKYGERKFTIANGDVHNEFHDCGIFYYTKNPYKLCIMTKGKDLDIDKSSKIISSLSRIVYENIGTEN